MSTPQPAAAPSPQPQAPSPSAAPAEQPGASGLTPSEEATLARLQDKAASAAAGGATVRVRVEGAHDSMFFGGHLIGRDWTEVPERMAGPLATAAADAGVKLTQES